MFVNNRFILLTLTLIFALFALSSCAGNPVTVSDPSPSSATLSESSKTEPVIIDEEISSQEEEEAAKPQFVRIDADGGLRMREGLESVNANNDIGDAPTFYRY